MKNTLILVFNCGSSSLKFSILNVYSKKKFLYGVVDFIRKEFISVVWTIGDLQFKSLLNFNGSYKIVINFILEEIIFKERYLLSKLIGIGHRVVHGAQYVNKSVIINKKVLNYIKKACIFSPLHNPINLLCIKIILNKMNLFKKNNVAVFDTAFHQTIPKKFYLYGIPYFYYKKYSIRKYGAHGISCLYSVRTVSKILNIPLNKLNVIICHLGNGSSISIVKHGKCLDTSMGLTPLEGLIMGTRSGDIDPSIVFYMYKKLKMSIESIESILTKNSGLLGINGISQNFHYLKKKYYTNKFVKLSIDMFCARIIKYIGAYFVLNEKKIHALIFTGGIGENVPLVRKIIISKLSILGFYIDKSKNNSVVNKNIFINTKNSINILIIPSNEEYIIAEEVLYLINKYKINVM
ncbi:acetate/propionate family kinase [Buchnera aphidicola (Mollitrichosiphum nigrofasciatum)]|uniref:acetate/propionate family kinase n=1 Tax=Buchnera aphidicola TaxID=9 RepID=UPI0031B7F68E